MITMQDNDAYDTLHVTNVSNPSYQNVIYEKVK